MTFLCHGPGRGSPAIDELESSRGCNRLSPCKTAHRGCGGVRDATAQLRRGFGSPSPSHRGEMRGWRMTAAQESDHQFVPFVAIFVTMAVWEAVAPRRKLLVGRPKRWLRNQTLATLNSLLVRLMIPLSAVTLAAWLEEQKWGVLHLWQLPAWLAGFFTVVSLDLAICCQQGLFHAVPLVWRLQMVHHSDFDFDVTTGLRFHAVEIVLSALIKLAAVGLLGPPPGPCWYSRCFSIAPRCSTTATFCSPGRSTSCYARWSLRRRCTASTVRAFPQRRTAIKASTGRGGIVCFESIAVSRPSDIRRSRSAWPILRDERQTQRLDRMLLLPLQPLDGRAVSTGEVEARDRTG